MNKTKLIIFAILIIAVFSGLFILNKDKLALESKFKKIIHPYHGEPGFVIMSLPDFIFFDVLNDSSSEKDNSIPKESVKTTRMLYFHENKSLKSQTDSLLNDIVKEMNHNDFVLIAEDDSSGKGFMEVRYRKIKDNWNEATISFCNDSTLLLVNLINKLPESSIIKLSEKIKNQEFNFN